MPRQPMPVNPAYEATNSDVEKLSKSHIPPMTHPLGKHWQQPSADSILIDDTHAIMDSKALDSLADYSRSMPSGVYPGKMWKAIAKDGRRFLCWYGLVNGREDICSNNFREILIVEASNG